MTYRSRIKYNSEQKKEMWERWQRGDNPRDIRRFFDRPSSSIYGQLSPTGGIRKGKNSATINDYSSLHLDYLV